MDDGLEERLPIPCTDTHVRLLITGDRTRGQFALMETLEHGRASHPLHVHSREDELVYVLEGHVRFHLDGAWLDCRAGETIFLPREREHAMAIASDRARMLVLAVPAGLEGYYRELSAPVDGPCVYQDAERLVVVAARYGIDITGPAPPEAPPVEAARPSGAG